MAAGATALAMAIALVYGAISRGLGKDVDPWELATKKGAVLGAIFGLLFAIAELIPWKQL